MRTTMGASAILATLLLMTAGGQAARAEDKMVFDTDDQSIVKKSQNNICHKRGDRDFEKTLHFRAYRTVQDCLESGGRLPDKS